MGLEKQYVTDVDLTATTSTGDPEGEPLESHAAPSAEELDASLARLRGEIELPIPAASAVKIGGERAYKLARRGVAVDMPLRRSHVYALDVISYNGQTVRLSLHVGSGTYVRAIATALGGHCATLRRTAVGPFSVEEAEQLDPRAARDGGAVAPALIPIRSALDRLPADAVERVPRSVVRGVLALAEQGGGKAA